jgi:hypothetical protein
MNNFDSFDRKSFRKAKFDSRKKDRKSPNESNNDEYRFSKISKRDIKQKIQEMEEEEKWEDWKDEIH